MAKFADVDVLKEIPGYKAIMKAVLKSQIQMLVEQLSEQTDEETVLLTASVSEGSLSQLGSESGREFMQNNEELKSQFLGFCLKRKHRLDQQLTKPSSETQHQSLDIDNTSLHFDTNPYPGPQTQRGRLRKPHSKKEYNDAIRQQYPPFMTPPEFHTADSNSFTVTLKRGLSSPPVSEGGKVKKLANTRYDISPAETSLSNTPSAVSMQSSFVDSQQYTSVSTPDVKLSQSETTVVVKTEATDDIEITGIEPGTRTEGIQMPMDENQGGANEDGLGYSNFSISGQGLGAQSGNGSTNLFTPSSNTNVVSNIDDHDFRRGCQDTITMATSSIGEDAAHLLGIEKVECFDTDSLQASRTTQEHDTDQGNGGARSFPCPYCDKIFRARYNLTSHLLSHTGSRPHACQYCERTFGHRHNLNRHLRTVGELGEYVCSLCKDIFVTKCQLGFHEKSVHYQVL